MNPRPHTELRPGDITVIKDSREQRPLDLTIPYEGKPFTLKSEIGKLPTGDYAIKGLEHLAVVERKSLDDLIGVVTVGRERFLRELQRAKAYPTRVIIIEAFESNVLLGQYRSKVNPLSVIGSLYKWRARYGVSFQWAGDRTQAALAVARTLWASAQVYHEDLQAYRDGFKIAGESA